MPGINHSKISTNSKFYSPSPNKNQSEDAELERLRRLENLGYNRGFRYPKHNRSLNKSLSYNDNGLRANSRHRHNNSISIMNNADDFDNSLSMNPSMTYDRRGNGAHKLKPNNSQRFNDQEYGMI